MQFRLSDEIIPPKTKEGFYIDVDLMLGDADFYDKLVMGPFPKDCTHFLEEVILVLEHLKLKNANQYDEVEHFETWFDEGNLDEDDERYRFMDDTLKFTSPIHSFVYGWMSHEGMYYSLDGYKVYYVNEEEKKFQVHVLK